MAIKIGLIGIGNCAKSIVEGIEYYKTHEHDTICGYKISDIEVVCAIDISTLKVGFPLHEAIYASPNNAINLIQTIPTRDIVVQYGNVLDGVGNSTLEYFFPINKEFEESILIDEINKSGATIFINMLPTGADNASEYYANLIINKLGKSFINGMPSKLCNKFINHNFDKNILIGDDIKSQIGGSILHRYINKLFQSRNNLVIDKNYQLNYGGNTDFLNLYERGASKHQSKKNAINNISQLSEDNMSVNISYLPVMQDRKTCIIHYKGKNFGGANFSINATLEVEDSPNFAGSMVDAIRYAQGALDMGFFGILNNISALYMKTPPINIDEELALHNLQNNIF